MKEKADLILFNGKIYTVDSAFSVKEAMAISDGLIVAVGSTEELKKAWKSDSVIDLGGRAVYPGFNDGHCHFVGYALGLVESINLTGTTSFEEILQILRDNQQERPRTWIVGRGWDQNDWDVKEFPDNRKLNELFPSNPVVLSRIDGHAVLANSAALQLAGISADTKIQGGEILVRDGVPTGLLLDNAADVLKAMIPEIGEEAEKEALQMAQQNCFAVGLTSVSDAGLDHKTIIFIDSLQMSGNLKIRINAMLNPTKENFREFLSKGPFQKERLNVTSVKLYADGALGSRGALLLEPYSDDPGNYGLLLSQPDSLRKIIAEAYEKNFQVNTHCIGDSANRMMLHLYSEVLKGKNDRRWRIEHAQVVNPQDFGLFGMYSVIPSVQATHCTSDMYWAGERLGPERVKGAYAYKQLLDENGWLINGTDFPIEDISPLRTFYAAVARKDLNGFPEGGFQPENALSREKALCSITIWPAKGSFEENRKGSLEPGKFADFVILDKDIMTVDIKEVPEIKVYATYVEGERVYQEK
jgi:predicted amidohydrolase YtcJ